MRSSEEDRNAVELAFGVHQIDALVRDPEAVAGAAQAVLDEGTPDALALVSPFDDLQHRVHPDLPIFVLQNADVADVMYGARERQPRMGTRMARLRDAQPEQRAVIVNERARADGVLLVALERQPVGRVFGEEPEPGLELLR